MKRLVFRLFLVLAGLAYLLALTVSSIGAWSVSHPSAENLRRGIRWDPGNPVLWRNVARARLLSLDDADMQQGAAAYRQALARDPFDPLAWEGLATIESRRGDSRRQEAVLRAAVVAIPNSPRAAWRLANFLLVQDRMEESFPLFRTAAHNDPSLRLPVFELGWKLLGEPQRIGRELVPPDLPARMEYLRFLVWRKGVVREAYPVWEQLLPEQTDGLINLSELYVGALAAAGYGEEAARAWSELDRAAGRPSSREAGERVTNGDFEAPLRNAGLDWRMAQAPGFQITLDNFQSQSGSRSLRVRFDGTTNPDFFSVQQWVPVEPDTEYRFRAFLRSENISTDSGIFLRLTPRGVPPAEHWERVTEMQLGSSPWTEQQLAFRTGPHTRVLQLVMRRKVSTKLNNLLQGSVWLDNVSLRPVKN